MRVQILWDHVIIAEALTSVEDTVPKRCSECGHIKTRYWQLRQNDAATENLRSLRPSTHLQVRIEPE